MTYQNLSLIPCQPPSKQSPEQSLWNGASKKFSLAQLNCDGHNSIHLNLPPLVYLMIPLHFHVKIPHCHCCDFCHNKSLILSHDKWQPRIWRIWHIFCPAPDGHIVYLHQGQHRLDRIHHCHYIFAGCGERSVCGTCYHSFWAGVIFWTGITVVGGGGQGGVKLSAWHWEGCCCIIQGNKTS